jgi:hypothetical protein
MLSAKYTEYSKDYSLSTYTLIELKDCIEEGFKNENVKY